MTRKSIVARQKKREKIVAKFKNKREQLKRLEDRNLYEWTSTGKKIKKDIA